ncbi:hypothetical protein ACFW5U_29860 [Streptomyces rochei]|uniref:hypothetical protein n=1 Tax=Streptomyces rochei TaxID=1928 RepID=UPI00368BE7BE
MKPSSQTAAFVIMYGDTPRAVALDVDAARAEALTRQTEWAGAADFDYRWDEYRPGEVWRLMQRRKGPEGKGRRFSWTTYSVHTADLLGGAR